VQWKHASLGRRLSGDVVDFLKVHGARVNGKRIVGGPVSVPMDVDEAVVSTVDAVLKDITRRASRGPPAEHAQQATAGAAPGQGGPIPSNGGRAGSSRPNSPAMAPQQEQSQSGQRVFPEPPISGKTGLPVTSDPTIEGGNFSQGGYPSESGNREEDFSYNPPMPPGMMPPTSMP
jgi:hypothetical protein